MKIFTKNLAGREEYEEILRRNREEDRMRVLEGRQRRREAAKIAEREGQEKLLRDKQLAVKEIRNKLTGVVRRGVCCMQSGPREISITIHFFYTNHLF